MSPTAKRVKRSEGGGGGGGGGGGELREVAQDGATGTKDVEGLDGGVRGEEEGGRGEGVEREDGGQESTVEETGEPPSRKRKREEEEEETEEEEGTCIHVAKSVGVLCWLSHFYSIPPCMTLLPSLPPSLTSLFLSSPPSPSSLPPSLPPSLTSFLPPSLPPSPSSLHSDVGPTSKTCRLDSQSSELAGGEGEEGGKGEGQKRGRKKNRQHKKRDWEAALKGLRVMAK